ncbi:Oidioi.mRNA.OKI2018_I69.XSR.g16947.t1.cds [Oikopleura dioica]|uniref:Oidioi.mRNA.OKI2018_I69.XSR.g16947.t1.cds n=1 Tax=Oikopleura dioica TaxID=34765 RepID=A0ABN7SLW9_OIKDI|nr:Oidioi.mRNA.OKI2018_I69.XSR.g16947.t1.cds [Oikopleura dioica]
MSEETQNTLQEEEENGDDSIFIENPSTSPYDLVLQQNGTALPGVPTPWESQSFDYPTEPTPIGRIMRAISSVQDKCTAMPRNIILKGLVTIASSFLKTKISGSLKEAFFVFSIVINLILIAIAAYLIATLELSIDKNFILQSSNIFTCLILLFFLTEFPQNIRPLNIINLLLLNLVAAIFFQRHITGKMIIKSLSWVLEKIISYADSGSLWIYGGMEGDASSFCAPFFQRTFW